jgi:hypothetical protein
MAENNRNQSNRTEQNDQQVEQRNTQSGQRENIGGKGNVENNPQRGSEWSNYQTRELSAKQRGSSTENIDEE